MNAKDIENLYHRKDNRTIEQFKKDISLSTKREKLASEILKCDIESKGKKVSVADNGMDNTGKLITNHKKVNAKPDYIFIIDGEEFILEIKVHSEKYPFMTFKNCDLKRYYRDHGNVVIFRESYRIIIPTNTIKYILDNIKSQIYTNFSPNDLSHRIFKEEIENMIKKKMIRKSEWSGPAKLKIDQNRKFLFGNSM